MVGNLPFSDRNLILTGYTGPNQPAIGRRVAERLKLRFVDVEQQIEERTGQTSVELRQVYGERRLHTVESEIVEEMALRRNSLIRISGSILQQEGCYDQLAETGPVICLVARLDAVLQRLHLTMGARYHDPDERALSLGYLRREWGVRKLEGVRELDVTTLNDDQAVEAVITLWLNDTWRGQDGT